MSPSTVIDSSSFSFVTPIQAATALVIDTETDHEKNPRPVQIATIEVESGEEWMAYFNSGRPISAFVTRIHGITDADVADCSQFKLSQFTVSDYLIGHNVRFDWRVIGKPKAKLICTVKLARLAFPEWDRYGQSRCIEQLIGAEAAKEMTASAHNALADARMCYLLYQGCCERLGVATTDYEGIYQLLNSDIPVTTMPFGKHKGQPIHLVPIGYAKWMLANIHDLQPSLKSALELRVKADDEQDRL